MFPSSPVVFALIGASIAANTWWRPSYVCRLPRKDGPCANVIPRFYFHWRTGCRRFSYSGCYGNANNFATEEQCLRKCGRFIRRKYPDHTKNGTRCNGEVGPKQSFCTLPLVDGPCATVYSHFYFDTKKGCTRFSYSGCKGNSNNFKTEAECISVCGCPPKTNRWRE
uniref:Putative tick kunitz 87 n=1 Tax=Amblyomma americanum TaxID=6943 RepID=A0A0C9SDV9_AMBAM